jgi:hypothetical protein
LKKAEILNRGAIPEFVQVRELIDVYKIFTEASLKNKVLVKSSNTEADEAEVEESNIKDNIALV